jgi:sugar lactone lactonase YvrE
MTQKAEVLLETHCSLGEGAIWDDQAQQLYWVDIDGKTVFVYDPATGTNTPHVLPGRPGTVVKRASGGLAVAMEHAFAAFDPATGKVTTLAEPEKGREGFRMNDGKCDPAGRFWAGSLPKPSFLWRLDADHTAHQMLEDVACSNGIVWTRDRKTMLYIDTPTMKVDAFDYDDATGAIANRRAVVKIGPGVGAPDGCTIDAEDKLWIAMWGGGAVLRYDPVSGKQLEKIEIPGASHITSCAFGDQDLQTLYITCAGGTNEKHRQEFPNAGNLFKVRISSTRGVPAAAYAG